MGGLSLEAPVDGLPLPRIFLKLPKGDSTIFSFELYTYVSCNLVGS